jgi:hypothetical protein
MAVIQCNKCSQKLKFPDEKLGQRAKCPSCGAVQLLGESNYPPAVSATIAPPPQTTIVRDDPPIWKTPAFLFTVIPLGVIFSCCGGCGLLAFLGSLLPGDGNQTADTTTDPLNPIESVADSSSVIPADVTYTIIDETKLLRIKRSVEIRLNKRVSEDTLAAIAKAVKASDESDYERTFIGYYLPAMKVNEGYWATTHYDPDLNVRILGLSADAAAKMSAKPELTDRDEIGRWFDESPSFGCRIVIFRKDGKLFMESTYQDGSGGTDEIVESQSNLGRRFESLGGSTAGDHWILDSNGDLQLRDDQGWISTAKKIQ